MRSASGPPSSPKKNADAAFKLAKEVANAKDLQELLSLQSRYVQSQMQWYADQTQEFGKLMAKALTQMQQQPKPHQASARAAAASHKPSPKSG
jgi:hypothetical protein